MNGSDGEEIFVYTFIQGEPERAEEMAPLKVVWHEDIGAAVQAVSTLAHAGPTERKAHHSHALQKLAARYPILPLKFGTTAPRESSVSAILESGQEAIRSAFAKLSDKVEFIVEAAWEPRHAAKELLETDAVFRALKENMDALGRPLADEEKLALGKGMAEALTRLAPVILDEITGGLEADAEKVEVMPVPGKPGLLLEAVCIVEKTKSMIYQEKISEMEKRLQPLIQLTVFGPTPPLHFVDLMISIVSSEAVLSAMNELGAPPEGDLDAVKTAYQFLACQWHPDQGRENAAVNFEKFTRAYQLLTGYCRAFGRLPARGEALPPCIVMPAHAPLIESRT